MNRQSGAQGGYILFGGLWWMLHEFTKFGSYAWAAALVLMALGWLMIRIMARAVSRHGWRGWGYIAALIGYAGGYFYLAPDHPVAKLLVLWMFGVPLVLAGAGVQWVYDRYSRAVPWIERAVLVAAVSVPVAGALIGAWNGSGLLNGLQLGVGAVIMAGIPFFLGACLGESEPRELHDARFGSADHFEKAGMSDER